MAAFNYNYIFKYIIIGERKEDQIPQLNFFNPFPFSPLGDMGVGKSCLLHQFTDKKCTCGIHHLISLLHHCNGLMNGITCDN